MRDHGGRAITHTSTVGSLAGGGTVLVLATIVVGYAAARPSALRPRANGDARSGSP